MNNQLSSLKPALLWKHFEEICYRPHPSKHEEKIQEYILNFAKTHAIECKQDSVGNIILRKAATKGKEQASRILLQSHIDMVPQKNSDVNHDFHQDPIIPAIRDGYVISSKRTTLGADNGIGVAAMLAVFEHQAHEIAHGSLEALFTVDEEAGMGGALGLKSGLLQSNIMLNLDSEGEGEIYIGCAGGLNTNGVREYTTVEIPQHYSMYDLAVVGAKGGHSGLDIPLKRANAIRLMARLLTTLKERGIEFKIYSFEGGTLRNAIARECFSKIALPTSKGKDLLEAACELQKHISFEYAQSDPGITLNATVDANINPNLKLMSSEESILFVNTILGVFHGMKNAIEGMPLVAETSSNLGIVSAKNGKIEVRTLQRSAVESQKIEMAQIVRATMELGGFKVTHDSGYPGWKPNFQSKALKVASEIYEKIFHKSSKTMVTHGGLECGLITSVYPHMDAISIGPNIHDAHSPNERVEIASVERFWSYLLELLKQL
ncbi:MAG: aminoacyl-histidine dipeptidase [Oligoflexia bacterium]|nr:aminoacyl-histidine dipeptidase [Oligoflexia bacterium]MBF0365469.1 aminoacyl-histidine dipeptidase [Oligoflexia bacterium]